MIFKAGLILVYLAATFVCSAILVRLNPRGRIARLLRLRLGVFPFLPLLLGLSALRFAGSAILMLGMRLERLFVHLSGRQQYKRRSYGNNYRYGE